MHLIVLGASRPLGVLSVVPPGGAGHGSPPMGLQGLRAARMSTRPCGSGAVLCSSDTSARTRATGRGALARRPPGGRRRASSQGWAPQVLPRRRGDVGPAGGVLVAGDGGRGDCEFQADPAGEGLRGDVVVRWGRGVVEESGSRVLARARPAGAHCGDAVVGVVPCSRLGPGSWVLGAGGLSLVLGHFDAAFLPLAWPAGAVATGGTGW